MRFYNNIIQNFTVKIDNIEITVTNDSVDIHINPGKGYISLGDINEAEEFLQKVIKAIHIYKETK